MGNTSVMYRKNGLVTIDEITKTLSDINKEIFNNTLPITIDDNGVGFINNDIGNITWWLNREPYTKYVYNEEVEEEIGTIVSNNYIEYRDVPRLRASEWISDILPKEFSKRLGLINFCPAIDEEINGSYPKSFEEYAKLMRFDSIPLLNNLEREMFEEDLRRAKKYYTKELFEYFFDKDFKIS